MNVFAKNTQFVVTTGLPWASGTTGGKYSNLLGDIPDQGTMTNTAFLAKLQTVKANVIQQIGLNNVQIQRESNSYADWVAHNNYDEAHIHSDEVNRLNAVNDSLRATIVAIDSQIDIVKEKIIIENKLALSNASLTPAERAELVRKNAELIASQNQSASRSKNIKILAFSGALLLLLLGVGFVIYEAKKGKKSAGVATA